MHRLILIKKSENGPLRNDGKYMQNYWDGSTIKVIGTMKARPLNTGQRP